MSLQPEDLEADLSTHHIEGIAAAALRRENRMQAKFSMPLISHIKDKLWMGGVIDGVTLNPRFTSIISMYQYESYKILSGVHRQQHRMWDNSDQPDKARLDEIVLGVLAALERPGLTLVHCQAGLNRSGLITALVLRAQGMSSVDAIALLREKRSPVVLCNETFENYLLTLDEHDTGSL